VTGTFINVVAILFGGVLGLILGSRLPERIRQTVVAGLGLFTLAYGIKLFMDTNNALAVLGSLLFGVLIGEVLQIDGALNRLGIWLEERFVRVNGGAQDNRFVRGFVTASLVFCVGPMAILGSIQDGLTGDYQTLAVKSILDGFAALAFASSLGVGVLFSAAVVLLYQGGISLLAFQAQNVISDAMMLEMSATGGVLLLAIALSSLLEIKHLRTGNFLPALILAPLVVLLMQFLGVY
jgi:uncharacterized membrane protein YqgA involved in biofilm formation